MNRVSYLSTICLLLLYSCLLAAYARVDSRNSQESYDVVALENQIQLLDIQIQKDKNTIKAQVADSQCQRGAFLPTVHAINQQLGFIPKDPITNPFTRLAVFCHLYNPNKPLSAQAREDLLRKKYKLLVQAELQEFKDRKSELEKALIKALAHQKIIILNRAIEVGCDQSSNTIKAIDLLVKIRDDKRERELGLLLDESTKRMRELRGAIWHLERMHIIDGVTLNEIKRIQKNIDKLKKEQASFKQEQYALQNLKQSLLIEHLQRELQTKKELLYAQLRQFPRLITLETELEKVQARLVVLRNKEGYSSQEIQELEQKIYTLLRTRKELAKDDLYIQESYATVKLIEKRLHKLVLSKQSSNSSLSLTEGLLLVGGLATCIAAALLLVHYVN